MAKLGAGDYYVPSSSGDDLPTSHGRVLFLDAVRRVAPEVLRDLRAIGARDRSAILNSIRTLAALRKAERARDERASALMELLSEWMRTHLIDAEWVLDTAVRTLYFWAHSHQPGEEIRSFTGEAKVLEKEDLLRWDHGPGPGSGLILSPQERLILYAHEGWDPTTHERSKIRQLVRADFDHWLNGYLDRIEEALEERSDVRRNPEKRPRRGGKADAHFEWFARFQVLREKEEEIARQSKVDVKSVARGIKSASEQTRLQRRSTPQ